MLLSVRNLEGFEYGQSRTIFSVKDKTLNMLAPPEPIGDSLYLGVSHREDTTTPPDNFVMRLDRGTGRILWQTFLCMNTGKNVPMFGPFNDAPPIMVTYHEGDLYVASNNGCLAVLEAATGHIRWMRSYVQSRTGMMPAPPIVFGDSVIFGGVDLAENSNTGKVVAYDRIHGTLQWQRTFKIARDNPSFLEGIADGKLLISGPTVMCLSAKGGKILWKSDVLYSIVGKGALSNDYLYVPSADGIESYSLKDGSHATVMPWGEDSRLVRGNLMLLENGFIAYSDRAVTFFAPQTLPAPVKEKK
jgi:outer membrane protein assembly factor BamB